MIKSKAILNVSDNTGVLNLKCINICKSAWRIGAKPGDLLQGSVVKSIFRKKVKKSRFLIKGQICNALLVRTVYGFKRWGNFFFNSITNSCVIVNNYFLPIGTRIFGPVFREMRNKKFLKIVSKSEVCL